MEKVLYKEDGVLISPSLRPYDTFYHHKIYLPLLTISTRSCHYQTIGNIKYQPFGESGQSLLPSNEFNYNSIQNLYKFRGVPLSSYSRNLKKYVVLNRICVFLLKWIELVAKTQTAIIQNRELYLIDRTQLKLSVAVVWKIQQSKYKFATEMQTDNSTGVRSLK